MNEKFTSLDSIVEEIRNECEARVRQAETRAATAEIEAKLSQERERLAIADKSYAENVASRLIAYLDIAEKSLAQAREYALTIPEPVKTIPVVQTTIIDKVEWSDEELRAIDEKESAA